MKALQFAFQSWNKWIANAATHGTAMLLEETKVQFDRCRHMLLIQKTLITYLVFNIVQKEGNGPLTRPSNLRKVMGAHEREYCIKLAPALDADRKQRCGDRTRLHLARLFRLKKPGKLKECSVEQHMWTTCDPCEA